MGSVGSSQTCGRADFGTPMPSAFVLMTPEKAPNSIQRASSSGVERLA